MGGKDDVGSVGQENCAVLLVLLGRETKRIFKNKVINLQDLSWKFMRMNFSLIVEEM